MNGIVASRPRSRLARAGQTSRLRAIAAVAAVGLLSIVSSPGAMAQGQTGPVVQVICEVTAGRAKTVRLSYPTAAVRNTHVFRPVAGGPNHVFQAPATPTQIYDLSVPAGQYRLSYGPAGPLGNTPVLTYLNPVIVIAPFTVRGRLCVPSQQPGGPAS